MGSVMIKVEGELGPQDLIGTLLLPCPRIDKVIRFDVLQHFLMGDDSCKDEEERESSIDE